jgi:kynurenine formamidase
MTTRAKALIDLTMPLANGMSSHPSHFPPSIVPYHDVRLHGSAASRVVFSSHSGTHIDAPAHYFADGQTVDKIPLDTLIGPAHVIRVSTGPRSTIEPQNLPPIPGPRILLHTAWSEDWARPGYFDDFPILSPAAADVLVAAGVALIGFDSPSPDHRPGATHRVLLGSGVVIVENLVNLRYLPSEVDLLVMPLPLVGADACPVRAVAAFRPTAQSQVTDCGYLPDAHSLSSRALPAFGSATDAEGVDKYRTGMVGGISFALVFFCVTAIGPWSRFPKDAESSVATAVLGGLLAFALTTVIHGRRIRRGDTGSVASALASIVFGWVLTVLIGFTAVFVLVEAVWFLVLPFSRHVGG